MATDQEKLKHDLAKAQAVHAASLTPQLESIKHDFQQKLEAYKVSLIAEAEEVKNRGDVKKNIASLYVQMKFERLLALHQDLARHSLLVMTMVSFPESCRMPNHLSDILTSLAALNVSAAQSELFLDLDELVTLYEVIKTLTYLNDNIGPNKQPILMDSPEWKKLTQARVKVQLMLRARIHEIGKF